MAPEPRSDRTPPATADVVAAAVLAVPGVSGLHGGSFGIGTYLAGRRVAGIRLGHGLTEVHVTVAMGSPILAVADRVAAAVEPLAGTPVQVVVEDVTAALPHAALPHAALPHKEQTA